MKNILTALLTVLFLPVATLLSFALIAITLAVVIIFSPLIVLGGSILSGSYLSEKITDRLFPPAPISIELFRKRGNTPLFTSLGLTLLFISLTALPVAAAGVVFALTLVLSIPILGFSGAFGIAYKIVNAISPEPIVEAPVVNIISSEPVVEAPLEHSYHHFAPTIEKSLCKPSENLLRHGKEEEPSSPYSSGLGFFAPLLKCLRSLGNYADSAKTENVQKKRPSP